MASGWGREWCWTSSGRMTGPFAPPVRQADLSGNQKLVGKGHARPLVSIPEKLSPGSPRRTPPKPFPLRMYPRSESAPNIIPCTLDRIHYIRLFPGSLPRITAPFASYLFTLHYYLLLPKNPECADE